MAITEPQKRGAPPVPAPPRPSAPRAPDPAVKLAADLAEEKGRTSRLEARISELQSQVNELAGAVSQKDVDLGKAAQAMRQALADRAASEREALAAIEKVKSETSLYRGALQALVQIGDDPSLLLGDALGVCIQGTRRALAAYPKPDGSPGASQAP